MVSNVTIKKIFYATDLSENAKKAFNYAVSLATQYNASITIFHAVTDDPDIYSGIHGYIGKEKWEEIKNQHVNEARETLIGKKRAIQPIREALGCFCEDEKSKFDGKSFETDEIVVTRGNPVDEILLQSEQSNCDIIVMGTAGHGRLISAFVGSTSQEVISRSKKPVLLVRLDDE